MTSENREHTATSRWARVCAVLDAVHEAPEGEHRRVLAERCAGDASLRAEVESLLRAEARVGEQLESPILEWTGLLPAGQTLDTGVASHAAGDGVGPWRLVRELGQGGMGTVWLAEHADGQRRQRVALKLLKPGLDNVAILKRFAAERGILAHLTHPGIVRPIDGGVTADGRPYFTMEVVEGEPITRWCDARKLPVRDRLCLFLGAVDAVRHAHEKLVVHRDLKPSNLLVTPSGELKLLDFGIAKLLDILQQRADPATLTRMGWRMLTPEYAAPEQVRGETVTQATDIYALGALLYELLAGRRPTPAQQRALAAAARPLPRPSTQVSREAAAARDTNPESLSMTLRGDLDALVLRALHIEPARRYGSAAALGEDLHRYLDGKPVRARPGSA